MRILLLTGDLKARSGWGRYAADWARALTARGHEVHAATAEKTENPPCPETAILRNPLHYLDQPLLATWSALRLRRLVKAFKPDVIHAMAEPDALLFPLLGKERPACVLTVHGTYSITPLRMGAQTRKRFIDAYAATDGILSVSDYTKRHLAEEEPALFSDLGLEDRIAVVKNGLDLTAIAFREEPEPGDVKTIIGVGAVKARKGYVEAVDACAGYARNIRTQFRYEIIGDLSQDPAYADRIRARITEHGLQENVVLRGAVSARELEDAYARADLFLLLSAGTPLVFEGFGLVFLEAAARGIPVIGPTTGGCPEAVAEGRSGYTCDPGNAADAAEKIQNVLDRKGIKRADCRAWAEENDIKLRVSPLLERYEAAKAAAVRRRGG